MELNINSPKYYKDVYGVDDDIDYAKISIFILKINHTAR